MDILIPARGGSKGIPGKNLIELCGHPLISWTIKAALESTASSVFVSTDCNNIAKVSQNYGASIIKRPAEFATDTATTESVITHFLESTVEVESSNTICLLQCTSPIRLKGSIDALMHAFNAGKYDSMLTVVEDHCFYWNKPGQPINYDPLQRPRRQDFGLSNQFLRETGSMYVFKRRGFEEHKSRLFGKIGTHITPKVEGFEIDDEIDVEICRTLMEKF